MLPLREDGRELEGGIGEPLLLIWVTLNSVRSPNLMYCETSTRNEVVQRVLVGSFCGIDEPIWLSSRSGRTDQVDPGDEQLQNRQ